MEIEREDYSPIRSLCHNTSDQHFNCLENPNSIGMLTQGMKQALEDRNFKVLYDIINKALELKSPEILKTIHEV